MTYKVHQADGTVTEHEDSPEMEAILKRIKEFNKANPDFWCHCDIPETGVITYRGHSCDVSCANCGGMLQIG